MKRPLPSRLPAPGSQPAAGLRRLPAGALLFMAIPAMVLAIMMMTTPESLLAQPQHGGGQRGMGAGYGGQREGGQRQGDYGQGSGGGAVPGRQGNYPGPGYPGQQMPGRGSPAQGYPAQGGMAQGGMAQGGMGQGTIGRGNINQHLGPWMDSHRNLPLEQQQRALEQEPGFRQLQPEVQQRYRDRLAQLNNMAPAQRERMLQRTEGFERLSLPQRQQVRAAAAQLSGLSPDRRHAVSQAFHQALLIPEPQRQAWLNSPQMRGQFSDYERGTIGNLLTVQPAAAQAGLPGFQPHPPQFQQPVPYGNPYNSPYGYGQRTGPPPQY